ncbi:MAG: chromosome segregation protein SMC, partial [Syntrophales bacterium]|jgi:chromosome segregation protein
MKAKVTEHESLLAVQQEDFYTKKNRISVVEQEIEFAKRKVQELGLRKQRSQTDQAVLAAKKEATASEIEALNATLGRTEEEIALLAGAVGEKDLRVAAVKAQEISLQKDMDTQKDRHIECVTDKARLKNLLSSLIKGKEDLKIRLEKEEQEYTEQQQKRQEVHCTLEELQKRLTAEELAKVELSNRREVLIADCEKTRNGLHQTEQSIEAVRDEESKKSARYHSMKEVQEHYEWCSEGVKLVMTKGRQETLSSETVIGLVADHIQVPKQYEAAVEAVLGDKLQYVVVRSQDDGAKAIDFLKNHSLGRGSFVPLKVRNSRSGQTEAEHLRQTVRLIDEVKIPEDLREVAEYLLGDVLVIPTLRDGITLWQKNGFMGTFVTPEGDMISPHGVLTGGSNGNGEKSLLKNKRETAELETDLKKLSKRLREEIEEKGSLRRNLSIMEDELDKLRTDIHRLEIRIAGTRKDLERYEETAKLIDQKLQVLEYEKEIRRTEIHSGTEQIEQVIKDLAVLDERELETSRILSELQDKFQILKTDLEGREKDLTTDRIQLASIEQKRSADSAVIARLEETLADLLRQEASHLEEASDFDRQVVELEALVEERLKELAFLYGETEEIQDLLGQTRDAHQETEDGIRHLDQKIKETRKALERVTSEGNELEIRDRELAYQMESIRNGIQEKYAEGFQDAAEQFDKLDSEAIKERALQLERDRLAIETFGEVNLLAVQECEQLQERFDFLNSQIADLNTSLQTLQKTITRMNRISRKRFAETFEAVNASFKNVFPRLFPGGKGDLILTDEAELLEAGVEMNIQVPGKRTQNVTLLSGGEKSMAAIALIFAIIMHRPSPFVLLDEVDAALDDANNNLYSSILKEIAQNSQIIMITHNKQSMEVAERLYGVTMQKQGISAIVSVQLH